MEHVARLTGVELVFSRKLTQIPLEGRLATTQTGPFSDTTILTLPNNRLQWTALARRC